MKKTEKMGKIWMAAALLAAVMILFSACAPKQTAEEKSLSQISKEILEEEKELVSMDLQELLDVTGIEAKDIKEGIYLSSADGLGKEEVIVLKMAEGSDIKAAEEKLKGYLAQRKEETRDYLPEVFALLEKSKVTGSGGTLTLLITENESILKKF